MRFVRSGSAELAVDDTHANGPALVGLHAGVTDRRMWAPQVEALRETHRVITYDRRGFGETRLPPPAEREAYARVDDLRAVMDAQGVDRAVLMGCSQGGRVAIDMALAHPDRVRALVLVACAVSGAPEAAPFAPDVLARITAAEAAERRGDLAALNELEAQLWLDGPAQPAGRVGGPLRELFLAMNAIALANGSAGEERAAPSAWERLEALSVPTLVVWGPLDFPHIDVRLRELVRRVPGARAVVIDGSAHFPNLEQPERFNRALMTFLEALR